MKRKKQRNKTKILLLIVGILVALIVGLILSGNLYIDSLLNKTIRSRKLTDEDAMINQEVLDQVKNHHIVNIALFGADNEEKAQWNN